MNVRLLFATTPLVLVASLAACSSSSNGSATDPTTCVAHTNPPPAQLAAPVMTFEKDVAPILVQSCAFSSCHQSQGVANHGLFLSATSADTIALVKTNLVAKSKALPTMPYVTPGDPDNSFILHKLDNDLCVVDDKCVDGTCGKSMPEDNDTLPDTSRDAIRRWIAQGAK